MYHMIGLREDGRMVLFDSYTKLPSENELEKEIIGFDYTQLLIIEDNHGQVVRFEYECKPKLRRVDLV